MKTLKNLKLAVIAFVLTGLCVSLTNLTSGQTTAANEPNYILREYMKVEPGMEDEYLKVEKVWKAVHQRRVNEGKIVAWTLARRSFYGTTAPYDYVTTTVFKSGKELEAANKMNWDYITKGMSPEDLAIANNTNKTRKMVSSQLIKQIERVQPQPNNHYYKITQVKAAAGKGEELEKLEAMMRPVFEEACKMGSISGWRFGENLFPRSAGSANYYRVITASSMDEMLKSESNDYLATAFKKVYPAKDWKTFTKQFDITTMDVELYEIVDMTK